MKHLSSLLLLALVVKVVVLSASIGDAIGLAALSALNGWVVYLQDKREQPVNSDIKEQLDILKQDVVQMNSKVGAMALRAGLRSQ